MLLEFHPMAWYFHALIASTICIAIYSMCKEGMILHGVRTALDRVLHNRIGVWISSPLYECLTCMASIWGTVYYFLVMAPEEVIVKEWLIFLVTTCGINVIFDSVFSFFEFHKMMTENERDPD